MKKYYKSNIEEQESIINVDYFERKIKIYSSQNEVLKRLEKKLGEPQRTFTTKGLISGAEWIISFSDRRSITSALSRPLLIGNRK